MKAAFAIWNNRIAPVFDVARQIHIVETESGLATREAQESLPEEMPVQKALRLAELGVDTLVCGAISRPMHAMIIACGIRVIPFVAGNLREVIHAWQDGSIENDLFAMPGCWRQGLRFREMHGHGRPLVPGRNRGGVGRRSRWGHSG